MSENDSAKAPVAGWQLGLVIGWFGLLFVLALGLLGLGLMFAGEPGGRGGMGLFDMAVLIAPALGVAGLGITAVLLLRRGRTGFAFALCGAGLLFLALFLMLFGL